MPEIKETIYLVDGTSICYRSFFAIKLSTSSGLPTGAVYGFFQTLKKLKEHFSPQYLGICFDVSRKTFRQEKFKEYKIHRPPLPDGLKVQIPLIKQLVRTMGISLIEREGFEADDVIASLTKKGIADNLGVVIVTSDKDMYQLLGDSRVAIYNPQQERLLKEEDFVKEYGFPSSRIVDYLSLTGDSVDNIPGAKGIGKVGATKLIQEFGTIENIFNNLGRVSAKTKEILTKEKENILLSKSLATLEVCGLTLSWRELKVKEPDYPEIYKMFSELEFKTLLKEIPAPSLNVKMQINTLKRKDLSRCIGKETCVVFLEDATAYIHATDEEVFRSW
jgi:DNA polymerase-1